MFLFIMCVEVIEWNDNTMCSEKDFFFVNFKFFAPKLNLYFYSAKYKNIGYYFSQKLHFLFAKNYEPQLIFYNSNVFFVCEGRVKMVDRIQLKSHYLRNFEVTFFRSSPQNNRSATTADVPYSKHNFCYFYGITNHFLRSLCF